jgi:hypothetical protein
MNSHEFGSRLSNALRMQQTLLLSCGTVIVPLKKLRDLDAGMCVLMLSVCDIPCVTPTFRDTKDSLDTVLFTRDGDIHFPFANDDPELDKEKQPMTNTCDNDTELTKEQKQIQDEYQATYGTRHLPPNYPCAVIQSIVNNWGVAKRTINNLPVLTIDTNAAYTIDVRSGSAFPWLSGNRNGATTMKRYLRSAHPGL